MAVAGKNSIHKLDNSSGTLTDLSAFFQSATGIDLMVEMLDTHAFGDSAKESTPGLSGGQTLTLTGQYHATVYSHFTGLWTAQLSGSGPWTYEYSPAGSASGTPKISVETYLESVGMPTDVGGLVTFDVSLRATGPVTLGTN